MSAIYNIPAEERDRKHFMEIMYGATIEKRINIETVTLAVLCPGYNDMIFVDLIRGAELFCISEDYDWQALNQAVLACLVAELKEKEKKE